MNVKMVGIVPIVVSPTIHRIKVTKTLIDGGVRLNVISPKICDMMQITYDRLMPTKTFSGVTFGSTIPIRQVALPVTFRINKNYRTERIIFDVAHIGQEYNAILGYHALAQFMVVTHDAYNSVKMSGLGGVITIQADQEDTIQCI